MSSTAASFGPLAAQGREVLHLAMQRLWLTGRILPAGAHLTIQHVFRSEEEKPLEVIYSFPLPRDAALRAFRITGEEFEAHSELMPTEEAVKFYERGIAAGSLATLARQYDDGVVNLTVGNVRPKEMVTVYLELLTGVELRDDGFRFRFPFTLAPAYHARMKAVMVAEGEGEMELPADQFGDMILPRFREDGSSLHEVGFDLSVLHQLAIDEVGSPSHAIRVKQDGLAPARVSLAAEKDVPNRDLVLDVRLKEVAVQVLAGPTDDGTRTFAAIVPSTLFGVKSNAPRRTVIVLDRSGSMQGAPIEQASKAIDACLAALAEEDSFGLVAFNNRVETMDSALLLGTKENREKARIFLQRLNAAGGTELAAGFQEAARILNGGGDVLILTDGQVAGTEQILAQARAANIRLFCLGIGSASQDRFLSLLARETGGVSRFVTARERVDLPALDLFASMGRPVASGLKATGNVQPELPSSVFAGNPVLLFGQLDGAPSAIELTWDTGKLSLAVPPGDGETGQTVRLLQGSRLITDWESRYPAAESLAPLEKRKQGRVTQMLISLSQSYKLASREMSLVAVVKRAGDRADELPETRVVPVGMPQDVKLSAYFPAPAAPRYAMCATLAPQEFAGPADLQASVTADAYVHSSRKSVGLGALRNLFRKSSASEPSNQFPFQEVSAESTADVLVKLASQLEPDGGMPGKDVSERIARTVAVVLAFVAEGHTLTGGSFRSHVARLVAYLKSVRQVPAQVQEVMNLAVKAAETGTAPPRDWLTLAQGANIPWIELEKTLMI